MTYRIAQISDTHLSGDKPFFVANFQGVARHLAAEPPDLVVNTGDMSLDGATRESDLREARRMLGTDGTHHSRFVAVRGLIAHNIEDFPLAYDLR